MYTALKNSEQTKPFPKTLDENVEVLKAGRKRMPQHSRCVLD
jgi:hypothetical protein